jgi:hypothetical protein
MTKYYIILLILLLSSCANNQQYIEESTKNNSTFTQEIEKNQTTNTTFSHNVTTQVNLTIINQNTTNTTYEKKGDTIVLKHVGKDNVGNQYASHYGEIIIPQNVLEQYHSYYEIKSRYDELSYSVCENDNIGRVFLFRYFKYRGNSGIYAYDEQGALLQHTITHFSGGDGYCSESAGCVHDSDRNILQDNYYCMTIESYPEDLQ